MVEVPSSEGKGGRRRELVNDPIIVGESGGGPMAKRIAVETKSYEQQPQGDIGLNRRSDLEVDWTDSRSPLALALGFTNQSSSVCGRMEFSWMAGRTIATCFFSTYPLKLMVARKLPKQSVDAVWVYAITYGGGIVSGDHISFTLDAGCNSTVVLTTQASTKVYRSLPEKVAQQSMTVVVQDGALLAVLPDPVVCFEKSRYVQKQHFSLTGEASLVLVDWLTSGRRERGEVWAFDAYHSENKISDVDGRPIVFDVVRLAQGPSRTVSQRMKNMHIIAVVFLYGPRAKAVSAHMQKAVQTVAKSAFRRISVRHNQPTSQGSHHLAVGASHNQPGTSLSPSLSSSLPSLSLSPPSASSPSSSCSLLHPVAPSVLTSASNSALSGTSSVSTLPPSIQRSSLTSLKLPSSSLSCRNVGYGSLSRKEPFSSSCSSLSSVQSPALLASCSPIGNAGRGLLVRIIGESTAVVQSFLRESLKPLASQLGAFPYAGDSAV